MQLPTSHQLGAFIAVAESGSFSDAAIDLRMTQPAVSQHVRALETLLGTTLFERHARGAMPTPAADALLPIAREALRQLETFVREGEQLQEGLSRLRLAAIPTIAPYLLPGVVQATRKRLPETKLLISELRTGALLPALLANQIDLGLLATPIDDPHLDFLHIADDDFLLAVAEQDPLAKKSKVSLETLRDRNVLLIEDGHCLRGQAQAVCALVGADRTQDVEAAGLATVCQMVAAGQGVTLLPCSATALECRPGSGLVAIPFAKPRPYRSLVLAWRKSSHIATDLQQLARLLAGTMKAQLKG